MVSRRSGEEAPHGAAGATAEGPRLVTGPSTREFRLVRVRGMSEADERAWHDLGERAVEPNPLFEPDCLVPIAEHDPRGERVHLAVVEENGRFLAAIPLWDVMPMRFPYPATTSHVRRMQNLGTPLVDPTADAAVLARLLKGVARDRRLGRPRALYLDVMTADGTVAVLLRQAAADLGCVLHVAETYERGFLLRRPDRDYESVHGAKARYNLRRQRRQLSELFGGAEPRVVLRDAADPASVADFLAMEASGYKGPAGVATTSVPGEAEAFRDMCLRLARDGRIYILALEVSDTTIAMQIWLRRGPGLFLTKITYDERYARFGPGVLLQTAAHAVFHDETDAEWIDTCTFAGNAVLLRWYPDRRQVESVVIVLGRNPIDVAAVRAVMAVKSLRGRQSASSTNGHPERRSSTMHRGDSTG